LATLDDYKRSVGEATWRATQKYIDDVVKRELRIVFFSATPQGGGVALMRHALLRFLRLQGVRVEWWATVYCPDDVLPLTT
jgi:alpha,alpha-trehalose phosphorylase (configuration-retaining)